MVTAPKPLNEDARLKDLQHFEILDTENEKEYDGLVDLVSQICDCPVAIVNFIDSNRQWYKATGNLNAKEASRDESFCGHAIMSNEIFIISDATKDERFFDNPDVIGGLKVRFYAGAPIISSNGYNLGTVCAIDSVPRYLEKDQVKALKIVAEQVSHLLDLRKKNKQMLLSAKSMVIDQKKVAQMNFKERDLEEQQSARLLRDDIIPSISAVKEKIDGAIAGELDVILSKLARLSRRITPTDLTPANFRSFVEQLVAQFERRERIDVKLNYSAGNLELDAAKALNIFRIIQELFRFAENSRSSSVNLAILDKKGIEIAFEYDTQKMMLETQKMQVKENILNRVEMLGGTYQKSRFDSGETRIQINIPDSPNNGKA